MNSEKFLLDSNSLIAPSKNFYPFDFAMGFWEHMKRIMKSGNVLLLDVVCDEITKGGDNLTTWLKEAIKNTPCKITVQDPNIIQKYSIIQNHINSCNLYKQQAILEWADVSVADPWLIATAMAKNYVIITFEDHGNPQPQQKSKHIKIPDIADYFNVKYYDLFYFMRKMNFSWK